MSKNTDAATLAALTKLAVDTQFKTDEALEVWQGWRDRRWEAGKAEDTALARFQQLERKSNAARKAVETYKIAAGK